MFINFTTNDGLWKLTNPSQAVLLLSATSSDRRSLHKLKRASGQDYILGIFSDGDPAEYWRVPDIEAARLYVDRGFEPPEELALLLVIDDPSQPWLSKGARHWVGRDTTGYGTGGNLYETTDGLFVSERTDPYNPEDCFAGISKSEAVDWLFSFGHQEDSAKLSARIDTENDLLAPPPPRPRVTPLHQRRSFASRTGRTPYGLPPMMTLPSR
jgi:hypothetical protein